MSCQGKGWSGGGRVEGGAAGENHQQHNIHQQLHTFHKQWGPLAFHTQWDVPEAQQR